MGLLTCIRTSKSACGIAQRIPSSTGTGTQSSVSDARHDGTEHDNVLGSIFFNQFARRGGDLRVEFGWNTRTIGRRAFQHAKTRLPKGVCAAYFRLKYLLGLADIRDRDFNSGVPACAKHRNLHGVTDSDLLELVGEVREAADGLSVRSDNYIAQSPFVGVDTLQPGACG